MSTNEDLLNKKAVVEQSDTVDKEREDIVNKPIVEVPNVDSNKHNPKAIVDTSESQRYLKQLEIANILQEGLTAGLKNAERREREIKYNLASLQTNKKNQFKKFLSKSVIEKKKKPEIIASLFYDNKIYMPHQGWTLTEMALAWLEYFGLRDSITLEKMKTRIKSWIKEANETQDARIYGTPINGKITRYHIAKRPRDLNSQIGILDEFKGNIGLAEDKRKSLAQQIQREIEQEQKQEITIDTEGHPVEVPAEETQQESQEVEQQEEKEEQGGEI